MTDYELLRLRVRLAIAKDIAGDFRLNTSLRTIISNYESRIKEAEKLVELPVFFHSNWY